MIFGNQNPLIYYLKTTIGVLRLMPYPKMVINGTPGSQISIILDQKEKKQGFFHINNGSSLS